MNIRRTTAAMTCAAALTITGAAMAQPASAAPLFTGGLVNVNVSDIDIDALNNSLNDNNVLNNLLRDALNDNQVAVGVLAQVAAQVCDTNVGGILGQIRDTGTGTCSTEFGELVFSPVAR